MYFSGKKTIMDYLHTEDIQNGVHSMELHDGVVIDFAIINYTDDVTFTENMELGDDIEELNSKMLILKCHKNLTIEENVVLTPSVPCKGFTVYCAGTITNNGKISMTQRGVEAEGQNIYLIEQDGEMEIVPAVGAEGGKSVTVNKVTAGEAGVANGLDGESSVNRGTGGGASGGSRIWIQGKATSGAGSAGTSYSGGSGGGGCACRAGTYSAGNASPNGGNGGDARAYYSTGHSASGGTGNNGGKGQQNNTTNVELNGTNGTGGLLIVYSNVLDNKGIIESKGTNANKTNCGAFGGSSGGGSVNIFFVTMKNEGTMSAVGGSRTSRNSNQYSEGGAGGDGSVTCSKLDASLFPEEPSAPEENYNIIRVTDIENVTTVSGNVMTIVNQGGVLKKVKLTILIESLKNI